MKWFKKGEDVDRQQLHLSLDKSSAERLKRLEAMIPTLSRDKLIALALRSLEQKTRLIAKKWLIKKIRTLGDEGMTLEEIADRLNQEGIPPISEKDKWRSKTVALLLSDESSLVETKKRLS
jgi:hypothetical protein